MLASVLYCLLLAIPVYSRSKHIVLIVADDLGYNDVGFHNPDMLTPNIDMLAKSGVILESYYVQPICTPSRSQLMTGRYQIHTGLQHSVIFAPQPNCLPTNEVILPQKLKEAGYLTHAVGKWHLGFYKKECLPTYRGFDTFYGYYCGAEDYYTKKQSANYRTGHVDKRVSGFDFHDDMRTAWEANGTYSSYLFRERAIQIVKAHKKSLPLFLYLPFQSVHFPLQVPSKYIDLYKHVKNKMRRTYSGMVSALDDAIGDVVDALKQNNLWNDTLLVFTTDNGGQTLMGGNNWPLRGRKDTLWEGGIRGVGFVHGEAIVDKKRSSNELIHISDWFPTLLHVAGVSTAGTKPLDSYNVWDSISYKDKTSPRLELLHNIDPLFSAPYIPTPTLKPYPNKYGFNTTKGHSAIRFKNWKLLTGFPGFDKWVAPPKMKLTHDDNFKTLISPSVQLYHIASDPEERTNLVDKYPDVVGMLLEKLAAYNKTAVPVRFPPDDPQSNPDLHGGVW
uniref:Sulfatase N-terminal domain-containing protein n=1 Tax=Ciona savignyi TaxID=51511 RepID=H2YTS8_CIOSA